jgi:hypothetical protein
MIVILRICCFILAAGLWNLLLPSHCLAGLPIKILVRVLAIHPVETDATRLSVRILDSPIALDQEMTLKAPNSLTSEPSCDGSGEGEGVSVKNLRINDILYVWLFSGNISKDASGNPETELVIPIVRVTSAEKWTFPGIEKFSDVGVLDVFQQPLRVPVIVLLKPPDFPENTGSLSPEAHADQLAGAIEKLQLTVMTSLPGGSFNVHTRLESVPILSGRATLEGLKRLAAMPQVLAIEEDHPMQLHPSAPKAVSPLPASISWQEKGGSR